MKWREATISQFCRTGSGGTPARSKSDRYFHGHIPWVKSGELRENVICDTEEHITDAAVAESAVKLVPAGALLVALYGDNGRPGGDTWRRCHDKSGGVPHCA